MRRSPKRLSTPRRGGLARAADPLEDRRGSRRRPGSRGPRTDTARSPAAVEPGPVAHAVERKEERRVGRRRRRRRAELAPDSTAALKRASVRRLSRPRRRITRHRGRGAPERRGRRAVVRRVVAAQVEPASQPRAPARRQSTQATVYSWCWSSAASSKNCVESGEPDPLHRRSRAGDALEPDLGPEDQAGEAQPADRGVEQLGRSGAQTIRSPLERSSSSRVTWAPKVPGAVVVLAVDVVRDGAARPTPTGCPAPPAGTSRAARRARGSPPA